MNELRMNGKQGNRSRSPPLPECYWICLTLTPPSATNRAFFCVWDMQILWLEWHTVVTRFTELRVMVYRLPMETCRRLCTLIKMIFSCNYTMHHALELTREIYARGEERRNYPRDVFWRDMCLFWSLVSVKQAIALTRREWFLWTWRFSLVDSRGSSSRAT